MAPGVIPVPSGGSGGVENVVHELCTQLSSRGHEVIVVDVEAPAGVSRTAPTYALVEVPRGLGNYTGTVRQGMYGLTYQKAALARLQRILSTRAVDVVHFYSQFTAAWGLSLVRRYGGLAVFHTHNPTWGSARLCQSILCRAMFLLELLSFRTADVVITCGSAVAKNLIRFMGVPAEKVEALRNGLDDAWFASDTSGPDTLWRSFVPAGAPAILSVARLARYKNQATLVTAMRTIVDSFPTARLLLVGPASDRRYARYLKPLVMGLGLMRNVVFVGEIPREELRRFYRLCDLFVLPSLSEAQPMALLEAMAAGRPIVASAIEPVVELLPPGMHLVAQPRDTSRFAGLIMEVLRDSSKAAEIGARLREYAYQLRRWPSVIEDLEGIYVRALGRNKIA